MCPGRTGAHRRSRKQRGDRAERVAAAFLRRRGYRIVERNFRCRAGEIDLIARDGDTLVFVEVRARASARFGAAIENVTVAKQRQVARVARWYLAQCREVAPPPCRFDVVGITGDEVEHIRDAFYADGA